MRRIILFSKYENESLNDFIVRLGLQRQNLNLTWSDIVNEIEEQFGVSLSTNAAIKRYRRCLPNYNTISDIDQKIIDKTELFKLQSERTQLNNYYKSLSREDTLKEIGINSAQIVAQQKPFIHRSLINKADNTNTAILLIGDWHYGVVINSTFNEYNTSIAKGRVNLLFNEIVDLIRCNSIKYLKIINLGDMIAGNIHLPIRLNSQIDVMTQTLEVSELMAEFLYELSKEVEGIDYYSTLDNHSRIDPNKKDSMQLETLARITPWYLKERFKHCNNININDNNRYTNDIVSFNCNGFNILAVHGDKDKPQQIIDRLTAFTGEHQDLICIAHYHHFRCEEQNRTMLVSNGSLMGTDDYAMNLRLDSVPSQTFIVVGENDVCKDICKINLN